MLNALFPGIQLTPVGGGQTRTPTLRLAQGGAGLTWQRECIFFFFQCGQCVTVHMLQEVTFQGLMEEEYIYSLRHLDLGCQ